MENKEQKLKELEYEIKLFALRLKYAKRLEDFLALSFCASASFIQYFTIKSQPSLPKGGIAHVGAGNRPETIIKP